MLKKFITKYKKRLIVLSSLWVIYLIIIFSLGYKIPWFDKHPDWGYFPDHTNPNITIEEIKMDSVKLETIVTPLNSNKKLVFGYKSNKNGDDILLIYNERLQLVYSEKFPFLEKLFYPELDSNRIVVKYDSSYIVGKNYKSIHRIIALDLTTFNKVYLPNNYYNSKDSLHQDNITEIGSFRYYSFPNNKFKSIKLIDSVIIGNKFMRGNWLDFNLSGMSGGNSTSYKNYEYSTRFIQKKMGYIKFEINNEYSYSKLMRHYEFTEFYQFNNLKNKCDTLFISYYKNFYRIFLKK